MLSSPPTSPKALVTDCEGTRLTAEERAFFKDANPLGFILFKRHCESPEQLKALCQELRDCVGWNAPILIDQEGGRVIRMGEPHWRTPPAAGIFEPLMDDDQDSAIRACYLNSRLIAEELISHGVNVDCAPMLDIRFPFSHSIIGDRAFGDTADTIIAFASAQIQAFADAGVMPIMKHIPGHGRATLDSHHDLPLVDAPLVELKATDFVPFKCLNTTPWAMTAHIVYEAIDADLPATLSPAVIQSIREDIGFDGLLFTDDLEMKALGGSLEDRATQSLAAGCDVVLHCNGTFDNRKAVADACPEMTKDAMRRLADSRHWLSSRRKQDNIDIADAQDELSQLLSA